MTEQKAQPLTMGDVDDSSLTFDDDYTDEMVESIQGLMDTRDLTLQSLCPPDIHGRNPYGENGNGNGNGHNLDQHTPTLQNSHSPEAPPNDTQENYGLTKVASMFSVNRKRVTPQRLLHWIEKYKVVTPKSDSKDQDSAVYSFGPEEVAQVASVVHLLESGYKMREIVEMVGQQDEHIQARAELLQAFAEWSSTQGKTAREAVVESIAKIPSLKPEESQAFVFMQKGGSFPECAQSLGLDSEETARKVIDEAHFKIGRYISHLLLSPTQTPSSAT